MNLWFRLLCLLMASRFRPRLTVPDSVSRLSFRAWFSDLDINGHVNNGRYWTLFDLGRTDLILRSGLFKATLNKPVILTPRRSDALIARLGAVSPRQCSFFRQF